jgi:regulator of nucleoside diphosphate kinase
MKTITALPPIAATDHTHAPARIHRRAGHGIVEIGEAVVYRDQNTGRTRRVRVVEPDRVDPERGRISIASPVGAALVGLRVGEKAEWEDRRGNRRTLKVLRIEDNIEPLGYFNV